MHMQDLKQKHMKYATKFTREQVMGKENPEIDTENNKKGANPARREAESKRLGFPINAVPNRKASAKLDVRRRRTESIRSDPKNKSNPDAYMMPGSLNRKRG